MIYPPRSKDFFINGQCAVENETLCTKLCDTCEIAKNNYERELNMSWTECVIPTKKKQYGNISVLVNESNTVMKLNNMKDLHEMFCGSPYYPTSDYSLLIDTDEIKTRYPYWYALKYLAKLGEPKQYLAGHDLPLIAEYDYCVYMIAPRVVSEDI